MIETAVQPEQRTEDRSEEAVVVPPAGGAGSHDTPGGSLPPLRITELDLGNQVVFVTDADGTIVDVNDAFVRITGYAREEAIGSTPRLLASGYQSQEFYEELWQTISSGSVWQGQLIDRRRDGALRTYHATISPLVDGTGTITHYVALERDVTGELGSTPSGQASGLVHTDLHGRGTYANDDAAVLLHRRPAELLGDGLLHALREEDAQALRELIEQAVETGREHHTELRPTAGGWIRVTTSPLNLESGEVIGSVCVVEDVADLVESRRELDRARTMVRSVLDAFEEPTAVVAADGKLIATNRAWSQRPRQAPRDRVFETGPGDDLLELARGAAERGDRAARHLVDDLTKVAAGLRPRARHGGFQVTSLAWEEGGTIIRWTSDGTTGDGGAAEG